MRKIVIIICVLLAAMLATTASYADDRGRGHGERHDRGERHEWHGRGGFGLFFGGPLYYPYPAYPDCARVCRDRIVPVCRYDYWGDRWCHDEVVRDCRMECY